MAASEWVQDVWLAGDHKRMHRGEEAGWACMRAVAWRGLRKVHRSASDCEMVFAVLDVWWGRYFDIVNLESGDEIEVALSRGGEAVFGRGNRRNRMEIRCGVSLLHSLW